MGQEVGEAAPAQTYSSFICMQRREELKTMNQRKIIGLENRDEQLAFAPLPPPVTEEKK